MTVMPRPFDADKFFGFCLIAVLAGLALGFLAVGTLVVWTLF